MGRILWGITLSGQFRPNQLSFNPLTNGADIVGTEAEYISVFSFSGFNPLTNGADIVGYPRWCVSRR